MPQKKIHQSSAARQQAYRDRKRRSEAAVRLLEKLKAEEERERARQVREHFLNFIATAINEKLQRLPKKEKLTPEQEQYLWKLYLEIPELPPGDPGPAADDRSSAPSGGKEEA